MRDCADHKSHDHSSGHMEENPLDCPAANGGAPAASVVAFKHRKRQRPEADAQKLRAPQIGDWCAVFLEDGNDFFRPGKRQFHLGGGHPARVDTVVLKRNADGTTHEVTVSSDFIEPVNLYMRFKKKTFLYPSGSIQLLFQDNETGSFYQLNGSIVFEGRPEVLAVGDLVFSRFEQGPQWYRGRVAAVGDSEKGETPTCDIAYDDQDYETQVPYRSSSAADGAPLVYLAERGATNPHWIKGLEIPFFPGQFGGDQNPVHHVVVLKFGRGQIRISYSEFVACLFQDALTKAGNVVPFRKSTTG